MACSSGPGSLLSGLRVPRPAEGAAVWAVCSRLSPVSCLMTRGCPLAVFCLVYVFHGLLRERQYELYALVCLLSDDTWLSSCSLLSGLRVPWPAEGAAVWAVCSRLSPVWWHVAVLLQSSVWSTCSTACWGSGSMSCTLSSVSCLMTCGCPLAVFCLVYVFHGLLRERQYELYALVRVLSDDMWLSSCSLLSGLRVPRPAEGAAVWAVRSRPCPVWWHVAVLLQSSVWSTCSMACWGSGSMSCTLSSVSCLMTRGCPLAVFCLVYVFHGLLRERQYELYALVRVLSDDMWLSSCSLLSGLRVPPPAEGAAVWAARSRLSPVSYLMTRGCPLAVFCLVYVFHGLLRERQYELYALVCLLSDDTWLSSCSLLSGLRVPWPAEGAAVWAVRSRLCPVWWHVAVLLQSSVWSTCSMACWGSGSMSCMLSSVSCLMTRGCPLAVFCLVYVFHSLLRERQYELYALVRVLSDDTWLSSCSLLSGLRVPWPAEGAAVWAVRSRRCHRRRPRVLCCWVHRQRAREVHCQTGERTPTSKPPPPTTPPTPTLTPTLTPTTYASPLLAPLQSHLLNQSHAPTSLVFLIIVFVCLFAYFWLGHKCP